jgi:hypothetical protein
MPDMKVTDVEYKWPLLQCMSTLFAPDANIFVHHASSQYAVKSI